MTLSTGVVDYVVPLTQELRKTIYVRKVKTDKRKASARENQRRDDVRRQFARFRQLVKNVPSEQIVDVSYVHAVTKVPGWLGAGGGLSPT